MEKAKPFDSEIPDNQKAQ